MSNYLGIIIEQCLKDRSIASQLHLRSVRRGKSWVFLLASVPPVELEHDIQLLQASMVTDDHWYAHYFQNNELVVVYRDAVFHVTTEPASWGPAVQFGLAAGIPAEQLDFTPRTEADAQQFFDLV